jgi:hypothetical protein
VAAAYRPKSGTIEIDRIIPPLGRVRMRTGTHDQRRAAAYDRMLDVLPLDIVRLLLAKEVTLRELYDLWSQGRPLPSADELRPLLATLDAWLEKPLRPVGTREQDARSAFVELVRAIAPKGAGLRSFPTICRQLYLADETQHYGAAWNRRRAAALAFLRDVAGRRTELYRLVAEIPTLPEVAKFHRHPCTVQEARQIAEALGPKWGAIWWALCCHGLGPKEYWSDGWKVIGLGVEVFGQKTPARNRVVPLVSAIPAAIGRPAGFAEALERAELGVTPYDARRSYARWLDEIGAPDYLQDAFKGHGPKTMRALYKWGDIGAWLAEYGQKLRKHVGEKLQLEVAK